MSTDNKNTETARLTPRLILNPSSNKPITTTSSMFFPSSPIAAGVFYLPIIQKNHRNNRKGGRHPPKHLRKPPSFDTYLPPTTTTHCGYLTRTTRTPSLSSSYSSTSSLVDNVSEYTNEEMLYGYCSPKSSSVSTSPVNRHRRISSAYKVRFAETSDDGISIVSSSSSVDDWDDMEEEEEDYIFVTQQSPRRDYFSHKKNGST